MEKLTIQIAAMYIGQKCDFRWKNDPRFGGEEYVFCDLSAPIIANYSMSKCEVVPYLRRLESMKEEEAVQIFEIATGEKWDYNFESARSSFLKNLEEEAEGNTAWSCLENWWNNDMELFAENSVRYIGKPDVWVKLLSMGFDLFNLIESGFAKELN